MKNKILLILFLVLTLFVGFAGNNTAQWVDTEEYSSFNFIAPSGFGYTTTEVLFPVTKVTSYDYTDTIDITIDNMVNIAKIDTTDGNSVFNFTINSQVTAGANAILLIPSGSTVDTIYLNDGFYFTDVAGATQTASTTETIATVANKTKVLQCIYDGTTFIRTGYYQLD